MPGHSFQFLAKVYEAAAAVIGFIQFFELGHALESFLKRVAEWNHLGDPVAVPVFVFKGPAHVAYNGARSHGSKGDDLGNPVAPVFLGDVCDDFVAPVICEIKIDIRHGNALRV